MQLAYLAWALWIVCWTEESALPHWCLYSTEQLYTVRSFCWLYIIISSITVWRAVHSQYKEESTILWLFLASELYNF